MESVEEKNWGEEEMPSWGLEEKPIEGVTLQEFEKLCENLFERRQQAEEVDQKAKEEWAAVALLEKRVLGILTHYKKDKHHVANRGTVSIMRRVSVRVPKTQEEKDAFFSYLRKKDEALYWDYLSVNSQKLNSYYKQEEEIAREEGRSFDFKIPGVGAPTVQEIVSIRKGK